MFRLPTENLYKFTSIFGLMVMLASVYLPLLQLEQLNQAQIDFALGMHPLVEKSKALESRIGENLQCAIDEGRGGERGKTMTRTRRQYCARLKMNSDQIERESRRQLEQEYPVQQVRQKSVDLLEADYSLVVYAGAVAFAIGFWLAVWGFVAWYFKVQEDTKI